MKEFQGGKECFIERWLYTRPDLVPNKDGNIVLISKKSFGPLEVYEWGLDADNNAYELYEWLENDFYEDESYYRNIGREELERQIHSIILLFRNNGLPKWADFYEKMIETYFTKGKGRIDE